MPGSPLERFSAGTLEREFLNFEGRFHPAPGDSLFMAKRSGGPGSDARVILVRSWARELAARVEEVRDQR